MRLALLFLVTGFSFTACSNDVFVAQDASLDGPSVDDSGPSPDAAPTADAAPTEAGEADAVANDATVDPSQVACAKGTCIGQQACCYANIGGWPGATCNASSSEGQNACTKYLACDDSSDCPNQVCCATETQVVTTWVVSIAQCSSSCGQAGTVQLCKDSSECGSKSCQPFSGNPSWLHACQ